VSTQSHRPFRDDRVAERSDVLDGKLGQIIKEDLLPKVAARSRVAVQGQAVNFLVFHKMQGGRRCSCFSIEPSPGMGCNACFGTGRVGGYEKFGTHLVVWDVTFPNTSTVNVLPNYGEKTKPLGWMLTRGALYGSVEGRVEIQPNLGLIDELNVDSDIPEGSSLNYYLRGAGDTDWVPLNATAVQHRLGQPYLRFRVEFRRVSAAQQSPFFFFLYLRYQSRRKLLVQCDITPTERANVLEQFGTSDNWLRQNFFLCDEIRQLNPEDFFCTADGNERWKLTTITDRSPIGILTSWNTQARLIQYHESLMRIPVGGGYYPETVLPQT
jgi:hypothetical protein